MSEDKYVNLIDSSELQRVILDYDSVNLVY
jgi:hypothetical protein